MNKKYGWPGRANCFGFDGASGTPICGALKTPLCAVEGKCAFYAARETAKAARERTYLQAVRAGYYHEGSKYEPKGSA